MTIQTVASETAMTIGDWVGAVAAVVQSLAIVVGGGWAYFKFVRGRTFARRAEPAVSGELVGAGPKLALRTRVSLRNTGSRDVPLRLKAVFVYVVSPSDWRGDRSPRWRKIAVEPVFAQHDSIEAQEAISDEVLIPLPAPEGEEPLAYRLELRIYERREKPGGTQWSSEAIVPRALRPLGEADEGIMSVIRAAISKRGG